MSKIVKSLCDIKKTIRRQGIAFVLVLDGQGKYFFFDEDGEKGYIVNINVMSRRFRKKIAIFEKEGEIDETNVGWYFFGDLYPHDRIREFVICRSDH